MMPPRVSGRRRQRASVIIPTFIPLAHATRKYNIPENVLTRLVQDGRLAGEANPVSKAEGKYKLKNMKCDHVSLPSTTPFPVGPLGWLREEPSNVTDSRSRSSSALASLAALVKLSGFCLHLASRRANSVLGAQPWLCACFRKKRASTLEDDAAMHGTLLAIIAPPPDRQPAPAQYRRYRSGCVCRANWLSRCSGPA